jgi:hypothetical protein
METPNLITYLITCPGCGAILESYWDSTIPPGGIVPVECDECGLWVLSESEGNPEMAKLPFEAERDLLEWLEQPSTAEALRQFNEKTERLRKLLHVVNVGRVLVDKEHEIEQLKIENKGLRHKLRVAEDHYRELVARRSQASIDEALNSGDGTYKP